MPNIASCDNDDFVLVQVSSVFRHSVLCINDFIDVQNLHFFLIFTKTL